jgi:hypothetical protein
MIREPEWISAFAEMTVNMKIINPYSSAFSLKFRVARSFVPVTKPALWEPREVMFPAIGFVVLIAMVFGGFAITGGALEPVLHALPHEMLIIGGAALGALIIGNSGRELKALGGGFMKVLKGPKYKKQDYLDVIFLVSKLMKMLRVDGPDRARTACRGSEVLRRLRRISAAARRSHAGRPDLRHVAPRRRLVGHARRARGRGRDGQRHQDPTTTMSRSRSTRCRASPTRFPRSASSRRCSAW